MTDPDPTDCAGGLTGGSARWTLTFGGGPAKRHQGVTMLLHWVWPQT